MDAVLDISINNRKIYFSLRRFVSIFKVIHTAMLPRMSVQFPFRYERIWANRTWVWFRFIMSHYMLIEIGALTETFTTYGAQVRSTRGGFTSAVQNIMEMMKRLPFAIMYSDMIFQGWWDIKTCWWKCWTVEEFLNYFKKFSEPNRKPNIVFAKDSKTQTFYNFWRKQKKPKPQNCTVFDKKDRAGNRTKNGTFFYSKDSNPRTFF